MPVELRSHQKEIRLDTHFLKRIAQFLLKELQVGDCVLSLLLTNDREMARIHRRWVGEETPTDVLSFPMETKAVKREAHASQGRAPRVLGDIVISVETAAKDSPKDPMREISRLLIHGILHLIGFDHQTHRDRIRMDREVQRLRRVLKRALS